MNELLQQHGCSNVFTMPQGLRELMADISREVLREQPVKLLDFIAEYLSALLITREHGLLSMKLLDDLCDCRPTISQHLMQIGVQENQAHDLSQLIKAEIEELEPTLGNECIREIDLVKKILRVIDLDEDTMEKICQIARNSYRDFWYRKKVMEKRLKAEFEEPWDIAAAHTLQIYKSTKPSFSELTRAIQVIQSAYRGYHIRRHTLSHLKKKPKTERPKVELPGPPLDIAKSREIDLGKILEVKPKEDDMKSIFKKQEDKALGLGYDPTKTLKHVQNYQVSMTDDAQWLKSSRKSSKSTISKGADSTTIAQRRASRVVYVMNAEDRTRPALGVMPSLMEDESEQLKITFASTKPEEILPDDDVDLVDDDLEQEPQDPKPQDTEPPHEVEVPEDIEDYISDGPDSEIEDLTID